MDINEAVKQAQSNAEKMPADDQPQGGELIEGHVGTGGQVTTFQKPSMATALAQTSVIPNAVPFLKVDEFGLRFGKTRKHYTEPFKAQIDMTEDKGFALKHTLRFGNPATYLSTYDGVSCDKGGSWHDALVRARGAGGGEPYMSVDVLIHLAEDIVIDKDNKFEAGSRIAFNSSKTNFSEWTDFYQACAEADKLNQMVDVEIHFDDIHHNGNDWGVVTFKLP
ncbi:hypothetical protein P1J78_21540 [Psychromarinibacter sp. C21-152]|uniref:Uncharacterized protein n=1 Tax=Psychromarinibacter sediminicola TaxID=3033385 RepID=A0AAE3TA48_9RHOB|nr:hypothetical protein [Psychromarinibacter sediminicola]MDF0603320.1 hypothetical protein [Psychromarinibacter sediminicola]